MPDAAAKGEYGDANPWIIAVLVAIATFMEVLDTTIANVALRYISGGLAVSADEASWVITTYLVANSHRTVRQRLDCRDVRAQELLSGLHCIVHGKLPALRLRVESAVPAGVPCHPGVGRRRHDTGGAIDSGRRLPPREAPPGVCALRHRRRRRAGRRPNPRRLVERQSVLALVLSHQRAGRTDLARADLHAYSQFAGEEKRA